MKTSLVFKYFAFVGFAISESTILTTPPDASSCSEKNVTIAWTYNPANLVSAVWTFTNDTLPERDILRKLGTDPPTPPASPPLTVEFVENGTIQLINTSPSYTGTYIFKIADNAGNQDSDSVNITINDVPQSLVFQENLTTHTFTCSGSSSIPTIIRVSTSGGNFRYEASPYTSSVTTEGIECCYNGSAASCSTETFTANYDGTIYCQQVRDASNSTPDKCKVCCWCEILPWWWCIIPIVIFTLIFIAGGCTLGYWKYRRIYLFDSPRKWPCSSSKQNDDKSDSSKSQVKMNIKSTEKSDVAHKERKNGRETGPLPGDQRTRRNHVKPSPDARPNQRPQPNPPTLLKSEKDQDPLPSIGTKPSPDARPSQRPQPEPPTLLKSETDQDPIPSIGTRSNGKPEGDQRSGVPYENVLSNFNEDNNQLTSQTQPQRLVPIEFQPAKRKKKGKSKRLEP